MSKKVKALLIIGIVLVILAGAVSVYAAGGAVRLAGRSDDRTVTDGGRYGNAITDADGDTCYDEMRERGYGGYDMARGGIIGEYADLTGGDIDSVHDAMVEGDLTIWELAEQEGNFEALKAIELETLDAHIAAETDADELEALTEHRDAVAAATTAAEMPDDMLGFAGGYGGRGMMRW